MIRLFALTLALAVSGTQASAFSLVGTWICGPVDEPNFQMSAALTYKANGRLQHDVSALGDRDGERMHVSVRVWGTWTAEGSAIREEVTRHRLKSVHINGKRVGGGPRWEELASSLAESFTGDEGADEDFVRIRVVNDNAFDYVDEDLTLPCIRKGAAATS